MINVAVTGYYGTGSSAVLDFLEEYSNVSLVPIIKESSDYEHVLFYYAGGLFDLCNQLSHGNTVMGSDAAINRFIESMARLNNNELIWFGSYQKMFGNEFMRITNEFINSIAVTFIGRNCNHCLGSRLSLIRTIKRAIFSIFSFKFRDPRAYYYVYDKNAVYLSMPTKDELYDAARKYSNAYMNLFTVKPDSDFRVFDHLIWPQQIEEFADYLDPKTKIIVAQRDVRDIYIKNKYLSNTPYFPLDIHDFVSIYSRIVKARINHPNVIIVQFEDMIYNYDKFEKQLEDELGLEANKHINKKMIFNPSSSIDNTQIFRCKEEWLEESKELAMALPDLVYDFPYERTPDLNNFFSR